MTRKPGASRIAALTLGALGVVYGDIGTSLLYALREVFATKHASLSQRPSATRAAEGSPPGLKAGSAAGEPL